MLTLSSNKFDSNGFWTNPIDKTLFRPVPDDVALFDQNGYDLTDLEIRYALVNYGRPNQHRSHRTALKQNWFVQESAIDGAVLNHSLLFERKAYAGAALDQLKMWSRSLPLVNKIIAMRPKWGLDFSMDWVDREGNAFEILHWEYDGFGYEEIQSVKEQIEPVLKNIDWHDAGQQLLKRKHEWHHLEFFDQSDYKCNFFGISKERFKMVIWQ